MILGFPAISHRSGLELCSASQPKSLTSAVVTAAIVTASSTGAVRNRVGILPHDTYHAVFELLQGIPKAQEGVVRSADPQRSIRLEGAPTGATRRSTRGPSRSLSSGPTHTCPRGRAH